MTVTEIKKKITVKGDDDKSHLGLVHVITGDGKGKTTSSLGLSLRAVGANLNVHIIQFLKAGLTSEIHSIQKYLPSVSIIQYGVDAIKERQKKLAHFQEKESKWTFNPDQAEKEAALQGFAHAKKVVSGGECDMLILDEINVALHKGLIPMEDILAFIKNNKNTELVFTGRDAPKEIMDAADYVSIVNFIKHPWQKGVKARKGVEY